MKISFATAAVAWVTLSTAASAQMPGQVAQSCGADLKSLCSHIQPGGGELGQCLLEHIGDVSAHCRRTLARAVIAAQACGEDRQTICGQVEPGGGRVTTCMRDNLAKLSPACRQVLVGHAVSTEAAPAQPSGAVKLTVDMAKLTCADVMGAQFGHGPLVAAWLSGYQHAKAGSTVLEVGALDSAIQKVGLYCSAKPNTLLMEAVEATKKAD